MSEKKTGLASYENVDGDYLEKRSLKKSAGWVLLWALGVGAVISGDYGGWNIGLKSGGFGGLAIATVLMAIMYVCMVFSIAELSAALPHAGGFYSFTRNALGPTGGFICGLTDTIEYVITPAVIVFFIGGYLGSILPDVPKEAWWSGFYVVFVGINILGVKLTLRAGLVVTLVAFLVLVVFYISVLTTGSFEAERLLNIPDANGEKGYFLPFGWNGIFVALPFAIWFYLAIEQLPLAAEESHDVVRDMPKALIWGIITLLGLSIFTLVLNTGVEGGAAVIGASEAPLADGFKAVFKDGITSTSVNLIAVTGLVASFYMIIYAYGRVLFALSRAGYFPRWLSKTSRFHTPHRALILGALVGLASLFLLDSLGKSGAVGGTLLNMAVFGAVLSYAMVMFSYVKLRLTRPDLERPYRSPLGIPGAVIGGALSILALASTILNKDYQPAIIGVAVFLAAGIGYYLVYSRHRLVAQAPEEEVALLAKHLDELDGKREVSDE